MHIVTHFGNISHWLPDEFIGTSVEHAKNTFDGSGNCFTVPVRVHNKRKKFVFEHAQNAHSDFIPRMRKVLSGHVLSVDTFSSVHLFC